MINPFYAMSCLLLILFAQPALSLGLAADRPNLISIVTDDQGRWAMGLYGTGGSLHQCICSNSCLLTQSGDVSLRQISDRVEDYRLDFIRGSARGSRSHSDDLAGSIAATWVSDCFNR